jgi:hypothetical protein
MEGAAKTGLEAVVKTINTTITPAVLGQVVSDIMPFVLSMVMFGFGFYLIRRLLKGASKGKARI